MEIEIIYKEDDSILVKTADGNFHFTLAKDEYEIEEPLEIKQLIKNIWSNAKIKDSSLIIEIKK